jgi:hypothetical protein
MLGPPTPVARHVTKTSSVDTSPKPGDPVVDLRHPVRLERIATLDAPIAAASRAGDDSLYVAERAGTIRRLSRSDTTWHVQKDPVLDLTEQVGAVEGEQGLLGLAFSPDGHTLLVVSYTDGSDDGASVIADSPTPWTATSPTSGRAAKCCGCPSRSPTTTAATSPSGPTGTSTSASATAVRRATPTTTGRTSGRCWRSCSASTWARRSPTAGTPFPTTIRSSVRPVSATRSGPSAFATRGGSASIGRTGDLWIADVGAADWEEVDVLPASEGAGRGANLGWSLREGAHDTGKTGDRSVAMVDPIFEYSHDEGASITGGFVYRGTRVPELNGVYLFSDFAAATLRGLVVTDGRLDQQAVIPTTGDSMSQVSSFAEDAAGDVYVLNLSGEILRIDGA